MGSFGGSLGPTRTDLGPLGDLGDILGICWGSLGRPWGYLWGQLDALWALLGVSCGIGAQQEYVTVGSSLS